MNWKATTLIEHPDPNQRKRELARLIGVEDRVFIEVEGHARVFAIADEDLDRENDEKTSACSTVCNSSSVDAGTFTKNGPASLRRYTPSSTKCRACGRLSVSSCSSRACV
jgi:hypothetical protein